MHAQSNALYTLLVTYKRSSSSIVVTLKHMCSLQEQIYYYTLSSDNSVSPLKKVELVYHFPIQPAAVDFTIWLRQLLSTKVFNRWTKYQNKKRHKPQKVPQSAFKSMTGFPSNDWFSIILTFFRQMTGFPVSRLGQLEIQSFDGKTSK